jgi:hypothetical protein
MESMKILTEKLLHRTLSVIGFGQSKKASTYSSFLSKSAIETFSEIRRHERMEDLRGVPEWHDDLSALCSAVMIGHRD